MMKPYQSAITGHLDLFVDHDEEEVQGERQNGQTILIHGDSEGLRSFAQLLLRLADLQQEELPALPLGARLDAKGTGDFYDRYQAKSGWRKK
jgi:hypothetical protein